MNQKERGKIYALQSEILGRLSKEKDLLTRASFCSASPSAPANNTFADEKIAGTIRFRFLADLSHIFHQGSGKWYTCATCEFGGSKNEYHRTCSDWDDCPVMLIMVHKLGLSSLEDDA